MRIDENYNRELNVRAHAVATAIEDYIYNCNSNGCAPDHDTIAAMVFDGCFVVEL